MSTGLPVEVEAKGVQPAVLVLFHDSCIKVSNFESFIQHVSCHSPRVHGCVDAFSSHWINQT